MLKVNPTNAAAVVTRSYIDMNAKKYDEAAGLLSRAIELTSKNQQKPPAVFFLMLAAVENERPPAATQTTRARAVLKHGLTVQPDSIELVQAEYYLLTSSGDLKGAIEFIESKTRVDPKGTFRRLMVDVLSRAEGVRQGRGSASRFDQAIAGRRKPGGRRWCKCFRLRPARQPRRAESDRQRSLDAKALTMIRDYRKLYPRSVTFLQAECDLAARGGDLNRAIAITEEIDKTAPASTSGPLLRARFFAAWVRQKRSPRLTSRLWNETRGSPTFVSCWARS